VRNFYDSNWLREAQREEEPYDQGESYDWGFRSMEPPADRVGKAEMAGSITSPLASALETGGNLSAALPIIGGMAKGLGVISKIAGMIGRKKAEEEAEEQARKDEALRQAAWMSSRRERAVGRWGY